MRSGRFAVQKVAGLCNVADILTKSKSGKEMKEVLEKVGGHIKFLVRGEDLRIRPDAHCKPQRAHLSSRGGGVSGVTLGHIV